MMADHVHKGEATGRQAGLREAQALLTLLLPLALLLLAGLALQLGLLQGPVELRRSLLLLEADLLFSSLPLLFLFPLEYRGDGITLGDRDVSEGGEVPCDFELLWGGVGQWRASSLHT